MKNTKRIHKKSRILGAVILGALVLSGSAFAMPVAKKAQYNSNEVMTAMQSSILSDSNYIDQWNKEFASNYKEFNQKEYFDYFKNLENGAENEGAIKEALKNKDYESYKEAVTNLEGYPNTIEPIPKEEFKILAKLRQ
jgi:hypothetical protein